MSLKKRITVLLAEDHAVVREGLRALLQAEGDIEVVGEAQTGREAVHLAQTLRPEVVVMDIGMPLLNGVEATRQILKSIPATKILVLSAYGDDDYVEQVAGLGIKGYLVKQTSAVRLAKAIREVHKGNSCFSPAVTERLRDQRGVRRSGPLRKKGGARLTSREVEVLQLVAEGKANKQTAAELGISIKTVEKHRQQLMNKLNIHDTAGLTRYALTNGIIESGVRLTIE